MRLTVFLCLLMSVCLLADVDALGQSDEKKACAFNIAGMWRSEATSQTNPVFYGFGHDGRITVFGHVPDVMPQEFEMMASVGYKLDNPAAPRRIEFTATRGTDMFREGKTSMEIVQYSDDSFTTLDTESGSQLRWDRVQTRRYFLSFAVRSGQPQPGGAPANAPSFSMAEADEEEGEDAEAS